MQPTLIPEFSRSVRVDALPHSGVVKHIHASDEEKSRLARRFGLSAIHSLEARINLRPGRHKDAVEISGEVTGQVTQACVLTLTPLETTVKERFSALFLPANPDSRNEEDITFSDSADDAPEFFTGNQIDIGELAAQHFYLALDPYPRGSDDPLK